MGPRIDLFCRVIDNLGDIGVSWRLARQLTKEYGCEVRLWVDLLTSLATLEPTINTALSTQHCHAIQVLHWTDDEQVAMQFDDMPDIVIAAFSCELPAPYLAQLQKHAHTVWYQLDYLSAQPWVSDFHLQRSPRADGLTPIFFFPGFTADTGGLIREKSLTAALTTPRSGTPRHDADWLQSLGISPTDLQQRRLISVFTYAHAPIDALVQHIEAQQQPTLMLLPQGVKSHLQDLDASRFQYVKWQSIPFLSQSDYDRLLAAMDLNLVRGEDSFVRAIWAGQPFIWHIYPQEEREHHHKLQAWLNIAGLPEPVNQLMHEWSEGHLSAIVTQVLRDETWSDWQRSSVLHRQKLLDQSDLATRLLTHWLQENTKTPPPKIGPG